MADLERNKQTVVEFYELAFEDVRAAEDAATDLGLSGHAPLVLEFKVDSIAITSLTRASATAAAEDQPA